MDIKILPAITFPIINEKSSNEKIKTDKKRIKGKIVNVRSARNNEKGKTVITIISDEITTAIEHLNNRQVTILIE
ncbi:hypothetical protein OWM07_10955 [Deferribacter thermophilus]|uniref:hypothetical protein n=1 Tax=Deferribacter thermophilus TaxID=53573 RepID=UPI003C156F24